MSIDQLASILWRRRRSLVAALVASVAAVVAVTLYLPKSYEATATLYVGAQAGPETFIDTRLVEQNVRTYATLAANPNTAADVLEQVPDDLSRSELLERMSFVPIERTQLLEVTAEGASADEAQRLANLYATEFVERMSDLFEEEKAPAPISLSEPAVVPVRPAKPNPPLYIGLGSLLAVFLALGVALARERLDTRVRVEPEDDTVLGQPVVARIPRIDAREARLPRAVADRLAVLRTNIDLVDENPARVVVVTSPGVSEGKSTIAAGFAVAAAADGERVVLVEGDLRRPGLDGTIVGRTATRSRVGLSNYLAGVATEDQIITAHPEHANLSVIWSGLIPPNPSALLGSHRLDVLIDLLRLDYDRVIVDTSPISVGPDASVIAARADGALYVVDERTTKRRSAVAGLNQLKSVRARLLGVVLNRSTLAEADPYYYAPDGSREEVEAAGAGVVPDASERLS